MSLECVVSDTLQALIGHPDNPVTRQRFERAVLHAAYAYLCTEYSLAGWKFRLVSGESVTVRNHEHPQDFASVEVGRETGYRALFVDPSGLYCEPRTVEKMAELGWNSGLGWGRLPRTQGSASGPRSIRPVMTPEDQTIVEARKTLAHAYRHRQPERSGRVFSACRKHPALMACLTRMSPTRKLLMLPVVPWKRIVGRTWP